MEIHEYDRARADFNKALEYDPENKSVKASIQRLRKLQAIQDKKDKARYKNLFEKLREEEQKEAPKEEQKEDQKEQKEEQKTAGIPEVTMTDAPEESTKAEESTAKQAEDVETTAAEQESSTASA